MNFPVLQDLASDLRFAWRALVRSPAFSLAAVCILGIGIGACAAVFSVVDRLLFRSLPYPHAEQLMSLGIEHPILPDGEFLVANSYLHLREQQTPFTALASWTGIADCDLTEENALRLACAQVDFAFLPTFGIAPAAGRTFTEDEDSPTARKVALISYALWHNRFGGERTLLGKTIPIDGVPTEVIGILPPDFELPTLQKVDLVVPQALKLRTHTPGETGRPLRVFGRLKPGVTIEQAKAAIRPAADEVLQMMPPAMSKLATFVLRSVRDRQTHDVKLASWILFATTLAILLIVCANVGNLVLARSESRRREFAMRLALGAGRWRLVRQTLTESLLLSGVGAAFGGLLAWMFVRLFRALAPADLPRIEQAALDGRVLVFLMALTIVCGVAAGLAPGFAGIGIETLGGWRAEVSSRSGQVLRRVLITAQIALSLTLLSDAGLLIESLRRMTALSGGLNAAESVTTGEMALSNVKHPNALSRQQFFDALAERLRANPLVTSVAISDTVPPSGFIHNRPLLALSVAGRPEPDQPTSGILVSYRVVSPGYFQTMGIRLLRGRDFTEGERSVAANSMIISASLARILFGNADPIGQTIRFKSGAGDAEIVGVAADVDNAGTPAHSDPEYYMLRKVIEDLQLGTDVGLVTRSLHMYDGQAVVIVRSAVSTQAVGGWIRSEAAAMDPTCAVTITTVAERVRAVSARPRFNATLLSMFALIGLIVAAIGLYGLIAFLVAQRTREIGVRLALGATAARITRMVLSGALRSTAVGAGIGLAGAIATWRVLRSMLFGIGGETQIGLLTVSVCVLMAVAVLASIGPALRASRVDPAEALRHD